jgi:hypothetical protein
MRLPLLGMVWVVCALGAGITQSAAGESIPCAIGNRANGFSYQPTPREVDQREASLGLRASREHQTSTDQVLEDLDRSLMRSEGLSAGNVPRFTSRQ